MFEKKLILTVGSSLCGHSCKGLLSRLWNPAAEQLRFRNRPNFKRPLPLHWHRERMLRLTQPIYPDELKVCQKKIEISNKSQRMEDNPYGVWLAKCMREDFYKYPMTAVFHTNSHSQHEFLRVRGMLFDSKFDMTLKTRQNAKVVDLALRGTKFEPVLRLTPCNTTFGYCKTDRIDKLLQVAKKMPMFILLGAVVDNRLLHRADLETLAKLNLNTARSQLCHTLNLAGINLSSTLGAGALSLSQNLTSYANSSASSDAKNLKANNSDGSKEA